MAWWRRQAPGAQMLTKDKSGNLIAKTDYNGLDIRYSYNRLGQLIRETHDGQLFATWEYDPQGNLLLAENDTTEQRYAYDAVNKLTESFDSLSGKTTRFSYDPQGNRTSETLVEDDIIRKIQQITTGMLNNSISSKMRTLSGFNKIPDPAFGFHYPCFNHC